MLSAFFHTKNWPEQTVGKILPHFILFFLGVGGGGGRGYMTFLLLLLFILWLCLAIDVSPLLNNLFDWVKEGSQHCIEGLLVLEIYIPSYGLSINLKKLWINGTKLFQGFILADFFFFFGRCVWIHSQNSSTIPDYRTKEQLGYVVECSPRVTYRVFGYCFVVQSSEYSPIYLQGRVENFINSLEELLVSSSSSFLWNAA